MIKLLFGILLGAGLMYFLDPRAGQERREMLSEKARNSAPANVKAKAEQAKTAGRETIEEGRERVKSVANHTKERVNETIEDAKREAGQFAESSTERAKNVVHETPTA